MVVYPPAKTPTLELPTDIRLVLAVPSDVPDETESPENAYFSLVATLADT